LELGQHLEALRRDPESLSAADIVRVEARAQGAFREYAHAFAERGISLAERALRKEAISSLVEAALVFEEELEDLESAADAYQRVLEIEGDHRRALFALGLLLHDLSRWDDLIALYRRRLEQSKDDGERTTLHLYIAELLSERFNDDHAAFKEIMAASRLAPRNIRIIGRLEKLGERTNRIDEVAVVIGDLILHQEDPRVRAALSLRLAELHLGPLADSQRALTYLRSALADDGGNPEILSEIEDVFRERARFDDLAELLEEAAKDRRVGPHRVRLERELARIYELELGDHKRALHALTRAAKIAFEDRELLDEVLRIGLVSSSMEPVAQTFEDVTSRTDNGLLRTYLRLKLGHIYAGQLARKDDAIRVYTAILEDDPSHQEAQRRMEKLGVFRQAVPVSVSTEGKKPESLAKRVGTSAIETRADDVPTEIAALGRGFGPESETALDPELHPPLPMPMIDDLIDVPRMRQPPAPPRDPAGGDYTEMEVQKNMLHESTMVMRARKAPPPPPVMNFDEEDDEVEHVDTDAGDEPEVDLDSEEHAIALLLQLDAMRPSDAIAADDHVEEMHSIPEAELPPIEKVELESSLPESYSEPPVAAPPQKVTDDLDERIAALQAELAEATQANDQPRIVEILEELVRTHERLNHDERAFFSVVRLAKAAPTLDRLEDAIRLGRRAQGYPLLIETVETLAPQLPKEAQVRLSLALAEVELEDLRDVSAAVLRLAKAHALAPEDNAVFERWIVILEVSRRFAELADVLSARAAEVAGTNEAISFVRRAAHIREVNLEDPRGAAEAFLAYLVLVPERDDLREEAASLLEKASAWRELAALLESTVLRIEGSERADVRLRIAKLYRDRLGDPQLAEQTLRIGLEERARDPALLSMLEESYEARGAWEELVDVLIRQLDVLKGARLRNTVRRKIAEISEQHLDDEALALEILADAIRDDAGDLDALGDLERLRRARGDWDGVREVLVLRSNAVPDPKDRSSALVAIAAIDAEINFDLDAAAEGLRDALEIDPKNEAGLGALATLEDQRGDYVAAMEVLKRLAEESTGGARARALVRLGRIFEERFDDDESAAAEYAQAYEADAHCLEAILALFRVREREEDYVAALELASRAAQLHEDERDRAALWRRAGSIAQDRVGDELRALECYERALAADPDDLATMATVGELFLKRGDPERAYPHLKHAAEGLSDPERKASLYHSAASAAEKTKKHAEAIECYEAALDRSPRALEPLKRLAVLYEGTGNHERAYELSALLLLHHETAFGPAEKAQVYLRMARSKQVAKDYSAAGRLAKKSHLLAETSAEPLVLLADVLPESGEAFEAAECLRKLSQIYRTPKEKRDALYRAAVLLAERANDVARASAMLAEAQTFIPEDIEVAELLAVYRERMQDARGAAAALTVPARLLAGRPRADLLVRAAKISAGPGRDRLAAKKLLIEALGIVPTHQEALSELRVMLELDGELEALVSLAEKAAQQFLEDPSTSRDAPELDRKLAALQLYSDVLRTYRLKLRDPERALGVLRKVLELSADEPQKREDLARLLDEVADKNKNGRSAALVKEAIGVWARLVEEQPGFVEGVAKLRALYDRSGEPALAHLQEELLEALAGGSVPLPVNAPEKEPTKPPLPKQRLDVPLHPLEKTQLEKLFTDLGYAPIKAFYEWMPEPKPKKKDLVGMAGLGIHLSRPLQHAAAVLGLDVPPVFVRDDAPLAIMPALVLEQPALIVSLALAEKRSSGELRFLAGRALSLLRPRALALVTVPLEIMRDGLAGFAKPSIAPETVHADPRTSKKRGKQLEKALREADRNRLAEEVGRWLLAPKRPTLAEEKNAVLRSAERAGLVASGSLLVSLQMLSVLSEGHVERSWRLPMIEWAQTRMFAEILRRLS
jgi:tetratricopeptide (TPR) repeat protein